LFGKKIIPGWDYNPGQNAPLIKQFDWDFGGWGILFFKGHAESPIPLKNKMKIFRSNFSHQISHEPISVGSYKKIFGKESFLLKRIN